MHAHSLNLIYYFIHMNRNSLIFIGAIIFLLLVSFIVFGPGREERVEPCVAGLHSHDGAPVHCDP